MSARGMERERSRLDVFARNVAAAQASTPEHPYQRLVATFDDDADGAMSVVDGGEPADALTEMVAMLDSQRAFEADASIFDVGKRLAERTIDMGRL